MVRHLAVVVGGVFGVLRRRQRRRPVLRGCAAATPRQHGGRHVVVGARHVRVTGQQVGRRDVEATAGAATVARLVDRRRRLRTLSTASNNNNNNNNIQ